MKETRAALGQRGRTPGWEWRLRWALAAVIFALAATLRLWPISAALPYIDYIDEGHVLHQALTVLNTRSCDTGWYGYPALPSYLVAASAVAYSPLHVLRHDRGFWQDLPPGRHLASGAEAAYDLISPPELIVLGRGIVAVCSIATVLLAGYVGKEIGGVYTGLCAATFTAVCPALVSRASIVIVDTLAAFFVLAALLFAGALLRQSASSSRAQFWHASAAGAASGFAYGSKYTAAFVFAAVLVAIAIAAGSLRRRIKLAAVAAAGASLSALISTPALVTEPARIVTALHEQAAFYDSISEMVGYLQQAISSAELGIPLIVAAICGLALMLRDRAIRGTGFIWLAFAVPFVATFLPYRFEPFRNLLPLVPLACIAAGSFAVQIGAWCARAAGRRAFSPVVAVGIVLLITAPMLATDARQIATRMRRVDSRVEAVDWLRQNVRSEERVLVIAELAFLPSELGRIGAEVVSVPWQRAIDALRQSRFDYVVASEFDLSYSEDREALARYAMQWGAQSSVMSLAAAFGGTPNQLARYYWRTNTQRILLLQTQRH